MTDTAAAVRAAVRKIRARSYPGSSTESGKLYANIPWGGLNDLPAHRGSTGKRVDQIAKHVDLKGAKVLDLGCGSGILGIAAAKLGAKRVLSLDKDPQAVAATGANAKGNAVADRLQIHKGSLEQLKAVRDRTEARVQVLVANITASTLEAMLANGLAGVVEMGGTIILSGILCEVQDGL